MPTSRAIQILAAVPYFSGLDDESLNTIAQATIRQKFVQDQIVFLEGDTSSGLYVVEEGWLKVVKMSPDGREQALHFLGPGEIFNALSVFTVIPNSATVIALEPSTVWLVPRDIMERLLESDPKLARMVIEQLAGRVQHLLTLIEDLSLRSVEGRLVRLLLASSSGGEVQRRRWATQAEMAARLGTVPDVLNRALRKLTEEGLIQVSRHQIRILDPDGLEKKLRVD